MKNKPIVMEHFSTVHTSFVLDFELVSDVYGEQTVLRIKSYL